MPSRGDRALSGLASSGLGAPEGALAGVLIREGGARRRWQQQDNHVVGEGAPTEADFKDAKTAFLTRSLHSHQRPKPERQRPNRSRSVTFSAYYIRT